MKKFSQILVLGLFVSLFSAFATPVFAASPYLSATYQGGSSSNVQLTVNNANSYSQVDLSYRQSSSLWTQVSNIGQTDGSGNFSQVVSIPSDNSSSQLQLYVTVGGLQSSTVSVYQGGYGGCTYNCGSPTGLSLSQNSLSLNVGQSQSVNIISGSGYYGNYYISSNNNSSVASVSINGNQLNIYANASGSTTVNVCQNNYSSGCASLYVIVSGGGCTYNCGTGSLSLSQTSLNLNVGQTASVTAYNNNGSLYVASNNNSGVASVSINGSSINFYGITNGSTNVNVCSNNNNQCAMVYVTVGGSGCGYYANCNNNISLSQTSLNLNSGQSSTVAITGAGGYYISSNSYPGIASASISGSAVYVNALTYGSTTINICQNLAYSGCASLFVTVGGSSGGSAVWFSQSNANINTNQTLPITIYSNNYGGSYYITSNPNSGVASANVVGNTLNINGLTAGTTTVTVCQSSSVNSCGSVFVTVAGGNCSYNCGGSLNLSQTSLNLNIGQSSSVTVSGNGSYYISSNSNSGVASANLSGNVVNVFAASTGTTNIQICQNSGGCVTLYVNVGGNSYGGNLTFNTVTLPTMAIGQYYNYQLQVSGGSAPYNFTIMSGSLPNGLSLSTSGLIFGTPNSSATVSFTIRASDNYGRSGSANFSIGGGLVLGTSTYQSGQLVNENNTVYIVYKNLRTPFANAAAFLGLGFKFSNVISISNSGLSDSGYTVTTSRVQHPWGSWIKSGRTVYFVHESGLIPVPNWDTLINNGGNSNLIVPANTWDFHNLVLTPMVNNDPRLQ